MLCCHLPSPTQPQDFQSIVVFHLKHRENTAIMKYIFSILALATFALAGPIPQTSYQSYGKATMTPTQPDHTILLTET